jgi:hypothetical protein
LALLVERTLYCVTVVHGVASTAGADDCTGFAVLTLEAPTGRRYTAVWMSTVGALAVRSLVGGSKLGAVKAPLSDGPGKTVPAPDAGTVVFSIAGVGVAGPPPRPVLLPAGTLYCTPSLVAAHDEHPAAGAAIAASYEAWPTYPLSTTGAAAEQAEQPPHGAATLQAEQAGSTTTGESTAVGA